MRRRHGMGAILPAGIFAAAAIALPGCAGDGPFPAPAGDPYTVVQRTIFDVNCLASGCHNASQQAGGLVLEASVSWANLVDREPTEEAARQAGWKRVVPFDTGASLLLHKLTGEGVGTRMPLGAAPLSEADIDLVRTWIEAGAPPAQTPVPTPSPTPPEALSE